MMQRIYDDNLLSQNGDSALAVVIGSRSGTKTVPFRPQSGVLNGNQDGKRGAQRPSGDHAVDHCFN